MIGYCKITEWHVSVWHALVILTVQKHACLWVETLNWVCVWFDQVSIYLSICVCDKMADCSRSLSLISNTAVRCVSPPFILGLVLAHTSMWRRRTFLHPGTGGTSRGRIMWASHATSTSPSTAGPAGRWEPPARSPVTTATDGWMDGGREGGDQIRLGIDVDYFAYSLVTA